MRCKACDAELSDREAVRKGRFTGEFMDLCDPCYSTIRDVIDFDNHNDDDCCVIYATEDE